MDFQHLRRSRTGTRATALMLEEDVVWFCEAAVAGAYVDAHAEEGRGAGFWGWVFEWEGGCAEGDAVVV